MRKHITAKAIHHRDRDLLINFYLLLATILLLGMGGVNQNAILFPENVCQISSYDSLDD